MTERMEWRTMKCDVQWFCQLLFSGEINLLTYTLWYIHVCRDMSLLVLIEYAITTYDTSFKEGELCVFHNPELIGCSLMPCKWNTKDDFRLNFFLHSFVVQWKSCTNFIQCIRAFWHSSRMNHNKFECSYVKGTHAKCKCSIILLLWRTLCGFYTL